MKELDVCPSTLQEGHCTYSLTARKTFSMDAMFLIFFRNQVLIQMLTRSTMPSEMSFSDTRTIGRADFEEFGKRIGLPEKIVRQVVDMFTSGRLAVKKLLRRSFLSAELQEQYWKSYDFRSKMLAF